MSRARTCTAALAVASAALLSACGAHTVSGDPVPSEQLKAATMTMPVAAAATWVRLAEKPVPNGELHLDVDGRQYGLCHIQA